MTKLKKQTKITKLFRKGAVRAQKQPSECDDLQQEVEELEKQLQEKQNELFLVQRNNLKHKMVPLKQREETFVRPQKIMISNTVEYLKRSLDLLGTLTGMVVQSYRADEHCCVVFKMQHDSQHEINHGLQILMKGGKAGEHEIGSSDLPLGFNLSAALERHDSLMTPECLGAVRKALFAYYDRLKQYHTLHKAAGIKAELFKTLDGSHIEMTISVQNMTQQDDDIYNPVVFVLDYRVNDIRPKTYAIKDQAELPEDVAEALLLQCAVFKKKPLALAFKEAFVSGVGPYLIYKEISHSQSAAVAASMQRRRKRFRPNIHQHNDDTFRPEDCSDQLHSDDED